MRECGEGTEEPCLSGIGPRALMPPDPITMPKRKNKFSFTDLRLKRIKPDRKRRCYYDAKCPGLELRVSPTGYRAFFFVGHRGIRERIGQLPPLTVQIARQVANEKRLCIELGINPVQRENLGTLFEKYRQDMIERKCHPVSIERWGRRFRHLEPWRNRRLDRITPDMAKDLQRRLQKLGQPAVAHDAMSLLRAMTNFAIRRGWSGTSPLSGIKLTEKRNRTRFIEPHELHGFISTLEERKDVFGDLILFALFTGVRRSDAEKAAWADIDLARGRWTFIGSKSGRTRRVYFSDYVEEIVSRRRGEAKPQARFVFENPFTGKTLTWVRRVMYRAEMVARGLPEDTPYLSVKNQFSMHTLRHSFITYALRAGIPPQVLQTMAGHAIYPTLKVPIFLYGHSTQDWEREGFQKVADIIRQLARKARPRAGRFSLENLTAAAVANATEAAPERPRERSLAAQKAAYLRYFRAKAAEERKPRSRSAKRSTRGGDTFATRAKQKVINQIVAMRDAGKSNRKIAFLLTEQGFPISHAAVWQILRKADAEKRAAAIVAAEQGGSLKDEGAGQ